MTHVSLRPLRLTVSVLVALALHPAVGAQKPREVREPIPTVAAASVGFDEARLARLDARMKRFVDDGQHAGIVMLLARKGRIVDWRTWGHRDVARQLPMEKDTIFRIYSMSKVITSVAVMTLHEEGRLKLDDPVAKYLPALKAVRVFKGGTAAAPVLMPARTPITIKHLLTHTSGFIYGFGNEPLDKIYNSSKIFEARSMDEFVTQAAKLPLAHEPGTRFSYGINTDILGAVVEKVSGKKFEDVVDERICRPLGMRDTGFDVPPEKMSRLAIVYEHAKAAAGAKIDERGRRRQPNRDGSWSPARSPPPMPRKAAGFAAGGSGMFSTIGDYARFAQMLLNSGELDGVRILGRKTVELMTANHLNHLPRVTHAPSDSDGFGLGVAVRLDVAKSNELGSVGQFGWSGAATTTVIIDPRERLVGLVFAQHLPYNEHDLFWNFRTLVYQALVE